MIQIFKCISGVYIIGIVQQQYVDSVQLSYPVAFSPKILKSTIGLRRPKLYFPCNCTEFLTTTEQYSIRLKNTAIEFELQSCTFNTTIIEYYKDYLKLQDTAYASAQE